MIIIGAASLSLRACERNGRTGAPVTLNRMALHRPHRLVAALAALVITLAGCQQRPPEVAFPVVDTAGLSPVRAAVVDVLAEQYAHQPPGPTYADGLDEPWCADFVSWVLRAAGAPVTNPNSGSWRIPGVATLEQAFRQAERFRPADGGYRPQVADVVIYDEPSPFGQHTNFVVAVTDGVLTTVGGNEGGIAVHRFTTADDPGLRGFGLPADG